MSKAIYLNSISIPTLGLAFLVTISFTKDDRIPLKKSSLGKSQIMLEIIYYIEVVKQTSVRFRVVA